MNPDWQTFLTSKNAVIAGSDGWNWVSSFGNFDQETQVTESGNIISDLTHYGLIRLEGDDTRPFLQGQLTNDVMLVDPHQSQLSSVCNPKGRMLANFRLFERDNAFYIVVSADLLQKIGEHLALYVMRSKVTISDASNTLHKMGIAGNRVEEFLTSFLGEIPIGTDTVIQQRGYTVIRIAGIEPRFEIYGSLDDIRAIWEHLDLNTSPVGMYQWELLNIRAGIPHIVAKTSEMFIPQMANMELINGVSFKKGCYTGQEIVARMHYLGKLKKRMYHIKVESDKQPEPGDKLFADESKGGSNTGNIVFSAPSRDGHYEALAVIQITDADSQRLKLYDKNGPNIIILDLPYSFTK